MDLVYAHRPGAPLRRVRTLTQTDHAALVRHYAQAIAGDGEELLLSAWRARHWFACDCRGPAAAAPLLYVRKTYQGQYVLVRMGDRPAHESMCAFSRPPTAATALEGQGVCMPKLAQWLFKWLAVARLNLLYPYSAEDLLDSQYISLKDAAKTLFLSPGCTLYDHSRTHAKGLTDLFKRLARVRAVGGAARESWGVFLSVIHTATIQEWRQAFLFQDPGLSDDDVSHWGDPQIQLIAGTPRDDGPFAVLTEFTREPGGEQVVARAIFAHPVYSRRQLIPVDSPEQRHTLRLLMEAQKQLVESRQAVICVRKVLPGSAAHERGIAFQVQRLGPNGWPMSSIDVMSVPVGAEGGTPPSDSDALYHYGHRDAGASTDSDQRFQRVLCSRLIDPAGAREAARHTGSALASRAG